MAEPFETYWDFFILWVKSMYPADFYPIILLIGLLAVINRLRKQRTNVQRVIRIIDWAIKKIILRKERNGTSELGIHSRIVEPFTKSAGISFQKGMQRLAQRFFACQSYTLQRSINLVHASLPTA